MSQITEIVRGQAFLPIECDIPDGVTLDEYRRSRRTGRRRRLPRLRRR